MSAAANTILVDENYMRKRGSVIDKSINIHTSVNVSDVGEDFDEAVQQKN